MLYFCDWDVYLCENGYFLERKYPNIGNFSKNHIFQHFRKNRGPLNKTFFGNMIHFCDKHSNSFEENCFFDFFYFHTESEKITLVHSQSYLTLLQIALCWWGGGYMLQSYE